MTLSANEVEVLVARSAADDADASLQLALHFEAGGDLPRAEQLFTTAFAQGKSNALLGLARVHIDPENFIAAVAAMKLACDRGHALACLHLSMAYQAGGYGLTRDREMAAFFLDCCKKAPHP